jgi:hypothetical protein
MGTAVSGWYEQLVLSVPGTVMLCAEWWGSEVNVFLAGLLCTATAAINTTTATATAIATATAAAAAAAAGTAYAASDTTTAAGGLGDQHQPHHHQQQHHHFGIDDTNATTTTGRGAATSTSAACLPLEAFPVLLQTMVIMFMPHFGFSLQGGAHIGNLLGAGQAGRARTASMVRFRRRGGGAGWLGSVGWREGRADKRAVDTSF